MATLTGNNPITSNGDYTFSWPEGTEGVLAVAGTFGSGTIKLQSSVEGTMVDLPDASFTAAGSIVFLPFAGGKMNLNLAGASSPSINVSIGKGNQ